MENFKQVMISFFKGTGVNILEAIAVLMFGIVVIKIVVLILRAIFSKSKIDGSVASFIQSLATSMLALFLFFIIMDVFNIDTTQIVIIIAASGLAVGLALQDILSNLVAGVIMIFTKPFKENDFISVGGVEGTVKKIKITSTILTSVDNITIRVPNKAVIGSSLYNYSERPTRRMDTSLMISAKSDIPKVREIIYEVAKGIPGILDYPAPAVMVFGVSELGIELKVRAWANNSEFWSVRDAFLEALFTRFQKEGITLSRRVHEISSSGDTIGNDIIEEEEVGDE
ncbi:MAG TPA: mechanosensitive ion channel family protein [Clostridia bacterium]|jgi:small conductance mechanosensitive channel|nr:mechanosensitive ion channel family protein [Clostridia bacterium]